MHHHNPPDVRASRARVWLIILREMLIFLTALLVIVCMLLILSNQRETHTVLNEVVKTNDQLIACTTPGHTCFDKATKTTREAILDIEKHSLLFNLCAAPAHVTLQEIEQCVREHGG